MKLSLGKDALLKLLQQVSGAVERRHTMAVLSNVKMELTPQELTLTASDLEVELVAKMELPEGACIEPGATTVSARKLIDLLKALPPLALVQLSVNNDGRFHIKSGTSQFTLGTLPAADFPLLGEVSEFNHLKLDNKALKSLLDKTAFAMAVQDVRFYLTGMLFETGEGILRTVATDGHRLALTESVAVSEPDSAQTQTQAILPRKGVHELQRLLGQDDGQIDLLVGKELIKAKIQLQPKDKDGKEKDDFKMAITFTSKLIDGKFPDYRRVLPKQGDKELNVGLNEFKSTLNRVSILSNEKLRGVFLNLNSNNLQMRANNPEQDEAVEDLAVDYSGDPIEMSFNSQYLLDIFNVMTGQQVQLSMTEPNASVLVRDPEDSHSTYVVMPMRV